MTKIILAIIIAALAAGACSRQAPVANKVEPAQPAPAPAAKPVEEKAPEFTNGAEPAKDIVSSSKKLNDATFWTATLTSSVSPGETVKMEYVAPDRYRLVKGGEEIVAVGRDSWVRENGKWQKAEDDFGGALKAGQPKVTAEMAEMIKDTKLQRKEAVGSRQASVYRFEVDGTVTTVWIADGTGLLLKLVTEREIDGEKITQTAVYDYDSAPKIDPPKM